MVSAEYIELKDFITAQGKSIADLAVRVAKLEKVPASKPAPKPAPAPKYVVVKGGDVASKWFATDDALYQMNPNFRTVAYNSKGQVMRRFSPARTWNFIAIGERLRTA